MTLEFLAGARPPLMRLYNFTCEEACHLIKVFDSLANGDANTIALDREATIETIGGCQLALSAGTRDKGMQVKGVAAFECILTRRSWEDIARLIDPFCTSESSGFHWLTDKGDASLLLSQDGDW